MKVVLDTSAIIYLSDFRIFDEMFTVQEVLSEVKDRISSMKLSALNLKVEEPNEKFLREIEKVAEETGDAEKLSNTDLKVLALAREKSCAIISDDRSIQNVAKRLGIKFISIFNKRISKFIIWGKYCKNCKRFCEEKICSICGSKTERKPKVVEEIKP